MSIKNKRYGKVEYLKADGIKAAHCFTTRLGGVSTGIYESMNLGMNRGDDPANVEENYRILGKCIGFTPDDLVLTHQVHSDVVRKEKKAGPNDPCPCGSGRKYKKCCMQKDKESGME